MSSDLRPMLVWPVASTAAAVGASSKTGAIVRISGSPGPG